MRRGVRRFSTRRRWRGETVRARRFVRPPDSGAGAKLQEVTALAEKPKSEAKMIGALPAAVAAQLGGGPEGQAQQAHAAAGIFALVAIAVRAGGDRAAEPLRLPHKLRRPGQRGKRRCAGLLSGFAGGRIDAFIMRVCDVMLSFPSILIALLIDGVGRALFPNAHDTLAFAVLIIAISLRR